MKMRLRQHVREFNLRLQLKMRKGDFQEENASVRETFPLRTNARGTVMRRVYIKREKERQIVVLSFMGCSEV